MGYDGYLDKVVPFIEQHKVNNIFVDSYLGTKLELKELGRILQPMERIVYLTACKMESDAGKKVLVCVTDSRLLILNKGWIGNRYQHSVFLDRVSSTQRGRGLVFGSVIINMMGNEQPFTLYGFWLKDTEQFVSALEDARFNYENVKRGFAGSMGFADRGYNFNNPDNNLGGYGYYGQSREPSGAYNDFYGYQGNLGEQYGSGNDAYGYEDNQYEDEPYVDEEALREYEVAEAQLNTIYRQGLIDRGTLERRLKQKKVELGLE